MSDFFHTFPFAAASFLKVVESKELFDRPRIKHEECTSKRYKEAQRHIQWTRAFSARAVRFLGVQEEQSLKYRLQRESVISFKTESAP